MIRTNCRLRIRREDEALLYEAEKNNLEFFECGNIFCLQPFDLKRMLKNSAEILWEEIYEECYLVSRYRNMLLKWDKFNFMIENILKKAKECNREREATVLMERMMLYQGDYLWIEEAGYPILIYKGNESCYHILDYFAEQMGAALEGNGQEVEYYDLQKEGIQGLGRLIGRHFMAIIGMQTSIFWVKTESGIYLHDCMNGPKYIFVFDHPVRLKEYLYNVPNDFHVITHDTNYVKFVESYFHYPAYFMPLAGKEVCLEKMPEIYDVSFVGTYNDYRYEMFLIHDMPREIRFVANRFLLELRQNPNLTAEEALANVFNTRGGYRPSENEFMGILWELRAALFCVIHYYRYRVIKQLLDAGLKIDVFGETWKDSPLKVYPNLNCHSDIDQEECIRVYQQSKLSLNIMAWHKGGFTERMANIMLCNTVLVTDDTTYLKGRYVPDEDLLVFHLDELDKLPGKLREYLEDKEKRDRVAENGRRKACQNETWDSRAKGFLRICERA